MMPATPQETQTDRKLEGEAATIVAFLREIGLSLRLTPIEGDTFLPGIRLEPGGLAVDADQLKFPGDLLHEAGHLAVMLPERRAATHADVGTDMGDEIAAQCWSYAAAVHLGLAPEIVFHEHGYKGSAQSLIETYRNGSAGVSLLQWMGLAAGTVQAAEAGQPAWPRLIRWLREGAGPSSS